MSRLEAYKRGKIFHTSDMIDWLQAKTGVPEDLGEALLGAWMGIIYHDAWLHADQEPAFLAELQANKGQLCLNEVLVPSGWHPKEHTAWSQEAFWSQIAQETGLAECEAQALLHMVYERLLSLAGDKAFEPLGWVTRGVEGKLIIFCWPDLLQPVSDDPEALLIGTL